MLPGQVRSGSATGAAARAAATDTAVTVTVAITVTVTVTIAVAVAITIAVAVAITVAITTAVILASGAAVIAAILAAGQYGRDQRRGQWRALCQFVSRHDAAAIERNAAHFIVALGKWLALRGRHAWPNVALG
ncbi:hypothetical protein [Aminobacter carboxidus]|uniref:Uncharacterized protein n=1 Tax=Aminobacter carboxidus TaxID=376165 RepID=A0ABR9GXC6_9HYPH|nr:hypothetical protein [Aminobacter carboxidus]MBE1208329.1 hypothetical protein [Aminobacter carboxidus]